MEQSTPSSPSSSTTDDPDEPNPRPRLSGRVRFNSMGDGSQPPRVQVAGYANSNEVPIPARPPPVVRTHTESSMRNIAGPDTSNIRSHDFAFPHIEQEGSNISGDTRCDSIPSTPGSIGPLRGNDEETSYFALPKDTIPMDLLDPDGAKSEDTESGVTPDQAASKLVRGHSRYDEPEQRPRAKSKPEPFHRGAYDGSYDVAIPDHFRGGVLAQLLKLYKQPETSSSSGKTPSPPRKAHVESGPSTPGGATTPGRRKWYDHDNSNDTLTNLIGASAKLANPGDIKIGGPRHKRNASKLRLSQLWQQEESYITIHIAGILARQDFLVKLCKGLMMYGAPTHRLEEYLTMTARVLEIEASFIYLPGCMIIAYDDSATHTTEVKMVRLGQGIDLGRLKDVHRIYKEVLHDVMGVEEATEQLDAITTRPNKFNPWFRVLIFGLTSATAAPFSFQARLIDLPLCFAFGCLVGFLQLIVAPRSSLYTNVFEVTSTLLISFLARAFGSIQGGNLFCFSALAQGGIVMLLPGYMFLSSSLELQARAIIPGSIRTVYGIIYSLLLGFGITVGSALYGFMDSHAVSDPVCQAPMNSYYGFLFVPPFVLCISILYQAKWKQMPMMILVAFTGYVVNYFASLKFSSSPQIAGALGAFTIGVLANLDSRIRHSVAAAILIPSVFTQVPGSLSSQGGLLSGINVANAINTGVAAPTGTQARMEQAAALNGMVFSVASSMLQISLGITVGLFLSAVVVYPFGKRRSALFSF